MFQFLRMACLDQAVKIGLAAAVLLASAGVLGAQKQYPAGPDTYYRYQNGIYEYRSVALHAGIAIAFIVRERAAEWVWEPIRCIRKGRATYRNNHRAGTRRPGS